VTKGVLESVNTPDDTLMVGLELRLTAVVGFVTVIAVVGFETAVSMPPVVVIGANADVLVTSPITTTCRFVDEVMTMESRN
jgi:hypothetical protein